MLVQPRSSCMRPALSLRPGRLLVMRRRIQKPRNKTDPIKLGFFSNMSRVARARRLGDNAKTESSAIHVAAKP